MNSLWLSLLSPFVRLLRMTQWMDTIQDRLRASIETKQRLLDQPETLTALARAAEVVIACLRRPSGTVFLAGNGGSACDAQHLSGELVGRFYLNRPGMPAVTLGVNPAVATALGNDFSYEKAFAHELDALSRPGDVFLGFSTSGNSKNVIQCLELCREKGLTSIGFSGGDGGRMRQLCDILLLAPSDDTPRIQESHITLGHILCEIVERELFPQEAADS